MRKLAIVGALIGALAVVGCKSSEENLPDKPQINADRTGLTFGGANGDAVWVGTQVKETPILTNGGRQALQIADVKITGTDAALFSFKLSGPSVESKQHAYVEVTYAPTAAGKHSASLEITSNAENAPTLVLPITPTAVAAPQP